MPKKWIPPSDLDPECLELCKALNSLPGIQTTSSCCGHGKPYRIWFRWNGRDPGMAIIARVLCDRYYLFASLGWTVTLDHGDRPGQLVGFLLEGKSRTLTYDMLAEELYLLNKKKLFSGANNFTPKWWKVA